MENENVFSNFDEQKDEINLIRFLNIAIRNKNLFYLSLLLEH